MQRSWPFPFRCHRGTKYCHSCRNLRWHHHLYHGGNRPDWDFHWGLTQLGPSHSHSLSHRWGQRCAGRRLMSCFLQVVLVHFLSCIFCASHHAPPGSLLPRFLWGSDNGRKEIEGCHVSSPRAPLSTHPFADLTFSVTLTSVGRPFSRDSSSPRFPSHLFLTLPQSIPGSGPTSLQTVSSSGFGLLAPRHLWVCIRVS